MSRMGTVLKVVGVGAALVGIGLVGTVVYMKSASASRLNQHFETHTVEFPIPFPLTEAEITELRDQKAAELAAAAPPVAPPKKGAPVVAPEPAPDPLAGVDLAAIALERAVARGKHYVDSRYVCVECHGKDFGGGVMIDDPAIGTLKGANITTGKGSRTVDYKAADWDRIVRHGVKPDGTPAVMPSKDFFAMSDRELSDVIAYIRSHPPVDAEIPAITLGPVGTVLMATHQLELSAEVLPDHQKAHIVEPPPAVADATYGEHILQVCTGCHRSDFSGGPIVGGDPSWVPAANLTPHETGIAGWTYDDFVTALREGKSKDGTPLRAPMDLMKTYAANLTETELQAMWAYLQTVEPKPDGI